MSRPEQVIPSLCKDFILSTVTKSYCSKDVILYALGIGVSTDPMDTEDLKFTYENSDGFSTLPSYAVVIPPIESIFDGLLSCPGMPDFNPMMLLHGEEKLVLNKALPVEGTIECTSRITDVYDKVKGALVNISCDMYEINDKTMQRAMETPCCVIEMSVYIRGIGGFEGGSRGGPKPSANSKKVLSSPPHFIFKRQTYPNQAILYRLSGDTNPLHIDPSLASMGGFDRPILHGLCSFGIATHSLVKSLAQNNPHHLSSIEARFASPVVPGDSLEIKVWSVNEREVKFEIDNVTSKKTCVSDGRACFNVPIAVKPQTGRSML